MTSGFPLVAGVDEAGELGFTGSSLAVDDDDRVAGRIQLREPKRFQC